MVVQTLFFTLLQAEHWMKRPEILFPRESVEFDRRLYPSKKLHETSLSWRPVNGVRRGVTTMKSQWTGLFLAGLMGLAGVPAVQAADQRAQPIGDAVHPVDVAARRYGSDSTSCRT
ncbi:MAG TPA: hypothetical protein VGD08_09715 [Stellaceae bacterium]